MGWSRKGLSGAAAPPWSSAGSCRERVLALGSSPSLAASPIVTQVLSGPAPPMRVVDGAAVCRSPAPSRPRLRTPIETGELELITCSNTCPRCRWRAQMHGTREVRVQSGLRQVASSCSATPMRPTSLTAPESTSARTTRPRLVISSRGSGRKRTSQDAQPRPLSRGKVL